MSLERAGEKINAPSSFFFLPAHFHIRKAVGASSSINRDVFLNLKLLLIFKIVVVVLLLVCGFPSTILFLI